MKETKSWTETHLNEMGAEISEQRPHLEKVVRALNSGGIDGVGRGGGGTVEGPLPAVGMRFSRLVQVSCWLLGRFLHRGHCNSDQEGTGEGNVKSSLGLLNVSNILCTSH